MAPTLTSASLIPQPLLSYLGYLGTTTLPSGRGASTSRTLLSSAIYMLNSLFFFKTWSKIIFSSLFILSSCCCSNLPDFPFSFWLLTSFWWTLSYCLSILIVGFLPTRISVPQKEGILLFHHKGICEQMHERLKDQNTSVLLAIWGDWNSTETRHFCCSYKNVDSYFCTSNVVPDTGMINVKTG